MKTLTQCLLGVLLFVPAFVFAGPDLDKGLQYFLKNDYKAAIASCEKALFSEADKEEAAVLLLLIHSACTQEDDEALVFEQLVQTAKDVNPYFTAFQITSGVEGTESYSSNGFRKRMEGFLDLPNLSPATQAMLQLKLVGHNWVSGKKSKAEQLFAQLGAVMNWSVTGSFENISGSGFDKDFPPIKKYFEESNFINKYGAEVQWFPLPKYSTGSWVDMSNHFGSSNSIVYAQTFLHSEEEKDIQIRIGYGGSIKAWLNQTLIHSNAKEVDTQLDGVVINVTLGKGINRLLLQIGEHQRGESNFMVRLTDRSGTPLTDMKATPFADTHLKSMPKAAKVLPNPAETYFKDRIAANQNPMLNRLLLIRTYLVNNKMEVARIEIEKALEEAPTCSYLRFFLGSVFIQAGNETSLNATLEKLKADDPENPLSLSLLLAEAMEAEDYEKAADYLEKYKASPWSDPAVTYENEIRLAAEEDQTEKLKSLINSAYNKYPNNSEFVALKYALELEAGNNSRALSTLRNYLRENTDPQMKLSLAGAYFDIGEVTAGFEELNELRSSYPESPLYPSILAKVYFMVGNYSKATQAYRACLKIAPFVGSYHLDIANVRKESGDPQAAIPYYEAGLKYDPYNYDAIRELRKLKDQPDLFEMFPETDVYELAAQPNEKEAYPNDNSLVLLDEKQIVAYEEGGLEERRILAARAFNAAGVDDWKEYNLPRSYYDRVTVEKAEIIKANGEKIKAESSYYTIVFTGLEPGDVVHLQYRTRHYFTGVLARHFWDSHYFQYRVPIKTARLGLVTPENKDFEWKVENGSIEPKVHQKMGYKHMEWAVEDQAAISSEPLIPDASDIAPTLHFTTLPSWKFVSGWYHDLADGMAKSDYEVRQVAEELFGDRAGLSDREVVERIYDYVVKEIRYSSLPFRQSGLIPQQASQVLSSRIGDCKDVSTLFMTLCREADIPASLVLVNTRNNGLKEMALPSINFNHCIAKVTLDGKDHYTELTDDYSSFGSFSPYLQGAFSLDINEGGAQAAPAYLNPSTRKMNSSYRQTMVTFEGEMMKVRKQVRRTGDHASGIRSKYRDLGHSDQVKSLQEDLAQKFKDLKVTEVEFETDLYSLQDPTVYTYNYEVNRPFTRVAGLVLVKPPLSAQFRSSQIIQAQSRENPLELWRFASSDTIEERMTIIVPEGMVMAEVPKNVRVSSPFIEYALEFKLDGRKLEIYRRESMTAPVVPVDQYPAFKKALDEIIRADDLQLGFKEGG